MYLGFGKGSMSYIYLALVYRDLIEERTVVDFQCSTRCLASV